MDISNKRIKAFLIATDCIGTIFIGVFLAAYLGGVPTTNVLHSEPAFRITLSILGGVLLILLFCAFILAVSLKKIE